MKRNTKKLAAIFMGAMLALMTVGCGKSNAPAASEASPEAVTEAETKADTAATEAVSEATAEESKEQGGDDKKPALPKVGIAWAEDPKDGEYSEDVQMYINAVEKAGGEAVMLPCVENEEQAKDALSTVGAVIMTGGEDIGPSYYKEEADENLEEVNDARDQSDFWMISVALEEDVPMLATCRGFQMLNVVCGGSLYQDIPTQYETDLIHRDPEKEDFVKHEITIDKGTKLADLLGDGTVTVNSWHHQCVKELGEGLTVVAKAPDGIVEGVDMKDQTYVMAVQFHPEWHVEDGEEDFLKFFTTLVDYASK